MTGLSFERFFKLCKQHFAFLENEYGFTLQSEEAQAYEAWVTFDSETTRVVITFEVGTLPWVEISRLESKGSKRIPKDEISLEILMRGVELPDEVETEVQLDRLLAVKAKALQEKCEALLRGDFHDLPGLRKKVEAVHKKRTNELFGNHSE